MTGEKVSRGEGKEEPEKTAWPGVREISRTSSLANSDQGTDNKNVPLRLRQAKTQLMSLSQKRPRFRWCTERSR